MQEGATDPAGPAPVPEAGASSLPAETEAGAGQDGNDARQPRRWLRRVLLLLGPLVVLAGAAYVYLTGGRYVDTDDAYVQANKVMIGAEVSGPIVAVAVRENQHVAKGQALFRIDDRPYRIALDQAEATLASTRDEIAGLKAQYAQKQAELALGRSDLAFASKEFQRQSELYANSATTGTKLDAARHDRDTARQRLRVTEEELAQIKAQLGGDPDIPVTRHPRFLAAKAERDRAALDLERTVVRAPFAGVASNTPELGQQVVGNGPLSSPVMSIVADRGAWVEANFKETDLTHVRPGQSATIRVDTYPDREWHGTVQSISQATGAEFAIIPPQNATGNWVKVVQRIPVRIAFAGGGSGPDLRAGMSTSVEIDTGHRRALPGIVRTALSWIGVSAPAWAAAAGERP